MATKRKAQEATSFQNRWLLPTNHYNLISWLSAGMILSPHSMEKYYPDCLEIAAGWIPVFFSRIARQSRAAATSKAGQLVVLDMDIGQFSGRVFGINREGQLAECQLPLQNPGDLLVLFLPAPLPAACIKNVFFETKAAHDVYIERSEEISSIPSHLFPASIAACPLMDDDLAVQTFWPPQSVPEALPALTTARVSAQGAMAALLFAFGNLSDATVEIGRLAFEGCKDNLFAQDSPFCHAVTQLMSAGVKSSIADLRSKLFWGVVERIIAPPDIDGQHSDAGYAVLYYLEQESKQDAIPAGKFQDLIVDLRGTSGLANYSHRELFEKHPGPFSHALLLFFLREHSDELLEFDPPDFSLTVADKVAAAILFAARDGWPGMPAQIRETAGLYAAISHRISAAAQKNSGSGIDLGTPPPRCQPLRELLNSYEDKPGKKIAEAALHLARKRGWADAMETRIRLGKGEYRFDVGSGGCELVLPGEVKAVETATITVRLLDHLSQELSVPPTVDSEVRKILGTEAT